MLIIGLNMAAIFQPVLLLLFLLQTADTVHRSDTSMHPGGSFLLKQLNRTTYKLPVQLLLYPQAEISFLPLQSAE